MVQAYTAFWFRRDLRLEDNAGLYHALKAGDPVIPVFIFDSEILDELPADDARVVFIHQQIINLQQQLEKMGSSLWVHYGSPQTVWEDLIESHAVRAVYTNHDYEPYAKIRDETIRNILKGKEVAFYTFQDQVIFEKDEVLTQAGKPYTVFTPYSRTWKASLTDERLASYDCSQHFDAFVRHDPWPIPSLSELGFSDPEVSFPPQEINEGLIERYDETRNYPAKQGTSRLGIHLRFGTLSIRKLVREAMSLNETFLNELIWREFYMQILWNFPHVVGEPFRPEYAAIKWRNNEKEFQAWCEGKTGYPLVDAGMRQLNLSGYMHNRVRMVTASFLTKHLLIDWRWGEAYFAGKLLDYELASNNGGWQWAAGCGTDAAPYFRIFNPTSQFEKFDPKAQYVKKWVPEYGTEDYPEPIVDHKEARERCLEVYKSALNQVK